MTEHKPEDLPRSISFNDEACPSPFFAQREAEVEGQAPSNAPSSTGHPRTLADPEEATQFAQPVAAPATSGLTPHIPEEMRALHTPVSPDALPDVEFSGSPPAAPDPAPEPASPYAPAPTSPYAPSDTESSHTGTQKPAHQIPRHARDFTAVHVPPASRGLRDHVWLPSGFHTVAALVVLAGFWCWNNWDREVEVTPEHRRMVLTAGNVGDFIRDTVWLDGYSQNFDVHASAEKIEARKRIDGELRVEYLYAGRGEWQPRLEVVTRELRSTRKAQAAFKGISFATTAEGGHDGMRIVEHNELRGECNWGDESRVSEILVDSSPYGYEFAGRLGSTVLHIKLHGLPLYEARQFSQLLDPLLATLEARD